MMPGPAAPRFNTPLVKTKDVNDKVWLTPEDKRKIPKRDWDHAVM